MSKTISILAGLLVAQILLAFFLRSSDTIFGGDSSDKKFLTIDLNAVNKITLQEKKAGKLVIEKDKERWVLPSLSRYPASPEGVKRLLDKLKETNKGWPVATTADAAPRFRVSPDDYAETITLSGAGGDLATVYLGSTSGHNRMHARADKDNDIISMEISDQQLSTNVDDWIDRDAVQFKKEDVLSLQLPQFKLERKDKGWQLSHDGKVEQIDAGAGDEVVADAGGMNVSAVLGKEDKPEYGLSTPTFSFTIATKSGQTTYNFAKMKDGNFYVLKPSNFEFFTKIDSWFIDRLKEVSADSLIKKSEVLRKAKEASAKESGSKPATSADSKPATSVDPKPADRAP